MVIQFICRGNALRSIIAEAYLKSLQIPNVEAISSGTVASIHKAENLVALPKTRALLDRHGIGAYMKDHIADDINQAALNRSDIVIFLNKIAYDEVAGKFAMPAQTYVWNVADLGEAGRKMAEEAQREALLEDVYQEIIENVEGLRRTITF